jgi:Ser/Thr protein kinase RdoA (MazF antagonist)
MTSVENILLSKYDHVVELPLRLEQVSEHEINSRNYYVYCGPKTNRPLMVLKEEHLWGQELLDRRLTKIKLYAHYAENEPLLPDLIKTNEGALWVELNDKLYRAIEFREGTKPELHPQVTRPAAMGLARIHQTFRPEGGQYPYPRLYQNLSTEELRQAAAIAERTTSDHQFFKKVRRLVGGQLERFYSEHAFIDQSKTLPFGWIHHDYLPSNCLFDGHRLTAILDMDSFVTDYRMQAVAFSASRFAEGEGQLEFLRVYNENDPLTEEELAHYHSFVRREAVRRLNWVVRVNTIERHNLWRFALDDHLFNIEKSYSQSEKVLAGRIASILK